MQLYVVRARVFVCLIACVCLCISPFPHFTKKSPLPFTTGDPVLTRVFVFRTHHQVDSIRTWLKWSKTKVMAELLLVPHLSPRTSSKTKEELPQKFRDDIITDFNDGRREAKAALLAELSKVTCDGNSDELSDAVSELKTALDPRITKQHVPSVVVVFRDSFDTALGDVFGGIVSRTVERPKEEEEGKSGRESDGA